METSIYGHDKYYKEFQSVTVGTLYGYKILCVDYNGYKLARFMDKNVSIACSEQLVVCLKELCYKEAENGVPNDVQEIKIPVNSVIDLVKKNLAIFCLIYS